MNVKEFLEYASANEISETINDLAVSEDTNSIFELKKFLLTKDHDTYGKQEIPRLASRALLQKGPRGAEILFNTIKEAPGSIYPTSIIETLWFSAHGIYSPYVYLMPLPEELKKPLPEDTIKRSCELFHDFVVECRSDHELFDHLISFLFQGNLMSIISKDEYEYFQTAVFEIFAESTIKLTQRLINNFEQLIGQKHPEEIFQQFLNDNPVLIDPLASQIIPKQKLGIEYVTDFVIRKLDNEYVLVEIEKPQDEIFTRTDDFTAQFTHAIGQIIDFQAWVEQHSEYARSHMPCISSPKGLLVIGRRIKLTENQIKKLNRYNLSLQNIRVLTFDDLVINAKNFYKSIHISLQYK